MASSCVHLAAELGHTDTLAYLLARGAQLEARDQAGSTPLMLGIHVHWEDVSNYPCVCSAANTRVES